MEKNLYFDRDFIMQHGGLYIEHTVVLGDKTVRKCPYYMLIYAAHGLGGHFIDGADHEFLEGDIVLVNPGVEHCVYSITNKKGMSVYCCSFVPDILPFEMSFLKKDFQALSPFLTGKKSHIRVCDTPKKYILELMVKMIDNYTYMPPGYQLATVSLLTGAIVDIMRLGTNSGGDSIFNTNSIIGNATNYIMHHVKEKILLGNVADHLHISPQHLCRVFKNNINVTFSEYVNRIRVEKIKNELVYTDRPIFIIYDDFDLSSKHLNRIFKQHTGLSMQEYRKAYNYKSNNPIYKWTYDTENIKK